LRTVPCYGARHRAGSTRLGPTREAMSVRRISAPAASHSVVVSQRSSLSRASRSLNGPPQEETVRAPDLRSKLLLRP